MAFQVSPGVLVQEKDLQELYLLFQLLSVCSNSIQQGPLDEILVFQVNKN